MSSEAKKPGADAHGDGGHGGGGHGGGGHGGPPHEEHEHEEGVPEWIVSFADNVALMMGFFVILLAMNMGPKGAAAAGKASSEASEGGSSGPDMLDMAIAIREAFNNPVNADQPKPGDVLLAKRILERRAKGEAEDNAPPGTRDKVQSINRGNYHALSSVVFFERDSSVLTPRNKEIINEMSSHLKGVRVVIEVRGHASADEAFHNNARGMELSFKRSLVVAQALAASNVDWRQVRLIPCGDNDRVRKLAYDESGHSQNERVEIIVTDEVLDN